MLLNMQLILSPKYCFDAVRAEQHNRNDHVNLINNFSFSPSYNDWQGEGGRESNEIVKTSLAI